MRDPPKRRKPLARVSRDQPLMEIIGHGMIAQSLAMYVDQLPEVVIFASGVANSLTADPLVYEREITLLYATLRNCRQHAKRFVYCSSGGAIYGPVQGPRDEMTPTFPTSVYGRHKLLCEDAILNSGAPYLILRLANLVGHRQNRFQLIPSLIHQIQGGQMTLFAEAARDLLDVEDFAQILVCLLEAHRQNDLIVLASSHSIPVVTIAEELQRLLGLQANYQIAAGGDVQRFNIDKIKQILPHCIDFEPDYYRGVLAKYAPEYR